MICARPIRKKALGDGENGDNEVRIFSVTNRAGPRGPALP